MISDEIIAEILQRTDIVELIGAYLPLRSAGRTFKALCPFHTEKTASFVVNPERQIFHCFGCGEGGDAIGFLMKHDRLSFPEAVQHLAERANVVLPARGSRAGSGEADGRLALLEVHQRALAHFRDNLSGAEGGPAREYLAGRGLSPELVERFQLGYALPRWDGLLRALVRRGATESLLRTAGLVVERQGGRGTYDRFRQRLMIPIWDASGKVIGFGGRALDGSEVKYLNSPETPLYRKGEHLFALNLAARAIRERQHAIVVEGYFDAITLHAHGFEQAVAVLGTALTGEQARLLGRYAATARLVFDPDAAGINAARRNVEQLVNAQLDWRIVLLPDALDPDAFVRQHGAAALQAALDGAADLVEFLLDRRVSKLDPADPLQRGRAVESLVEVVGAIEDPIRREAYAQRVAQRTGVTDRAVYEALARHRARAAGQPAASAAPAPREAPLGAEEQLVAIGLAWPAWRDRVVAALGPEPIEDPVLQRVVDGFLRGPQTARPLSVHPPEVRARVAALTARGSMAATPGDDAEADEATLARTVEDCAGRVRERRARRTRESLRQALAAAEQSGDVEGVLRLLAAHPSMPDAHSSP